MPVTKARKLNIKPDDLGSGGGGGGKYAALEVPGDYEATCTDVNEYEKGGKVAGWKADYEIEGLAFNIYMSFSEAARWKIVQVFEAHGYDVSEGVATLDPNVLIGETVGAHVDFDDAEKYREIKYVFNLDDAVVPEVEEVDLDEAPTDEEEPDIL